MKLSKKTIASLKVHFGTVSTGLVKVGVGGGGYTPGDIKQDNKYPGLMERQSVWADD